MCKLYSNSPPFAVSRRVIGSMYKFVDAQKLLVNLFVVRAEKGLAR